MVTIPTRPRVDLTIAPLAPLRSSSTPHVGATTATRSGPCSTRWPTSSQRLRDQNQRLSEELADARAVPAAELDESTVASLLGEEAARVLATAKEAASQIRAKADEGVEELLAGRAGRRGPPPRGSGARRRPRPP